MPTARAAAGGREMNDGKKGTSFRLSQGCKDLLAELAEENGISRADVIEMDIRQLARISRLTRRDLASIFPAKRKARRAATAAAVIALILGAGLATGCAQTGEQGPWSWSQTASRPTAGPTVLPRSRSALQPDPRLPDLTRPACGPCWGRAVQALPPAIDPSRPKPSAADTRAIFDPLLRAPANDRASRGTPRTA